MFIDKNSIAINGVSMGQYLTEAKFGYHKLWQEDTGRNLNGDYTGSLAGIYLKITMQFRPLTKVELETIAPVLDSAYQTTTYYDPNKRTYVTMSTYSNDWEITDKNIIENNTKNSSFSWAVISTKKRV